MKSTAARTNDIGLSVELGMPRILVVDDDAVVEGLVRECFRNQYVVKAIVSCVDLVYVLESFKPHLIILDVGLPWINGIDICRDLRHSTKYNRIPILFLSAMKSPEDVKAGLGAGANGYLTKPFHPARLKSLVAKILDSGARTRPYPN